MEDANRGLLAGRQRAGVVGNRGALGAFPPEVLDGGVEAEDVPRLAAGAQTEAG